MRITCALKQQAGLTCHDRVGSLTVGYAKSFEHETRKQARDKLWASPVAAMKALKHSSVTVYDINHLCKNLVPRRFLFNLSCWRQQTLTPQQWELNH